MAEKIEKMATSKSKYEVAETIKEVKEEEKKQEEVNERLADWVPKTKLGWKVKRGEITNIDQILDRGLKIREVEIVDALLPNLQYQFLLVGQAKGKFGGGKRKLYWVTKRKTAEGNVPKFHAVAVVGDGQGHVGVGIGSSNETVPARIKAIKQAKLNIFKIKLGCGSWECNCGENHSIPYEVEGKCGSVRIKLMPAPKGTKLAINDTCKVILSLAGIKDIWSAARGQTTTRLNLIYACIDALKNLRKVRVK